jgi:FSR family fosmidomycin resistance protein-like MFS transporter
MNQRPGSGARTSPSIAVLVAISFCHLLNDTTQSLIPSIYPLIKDSLKIDYGQVGLITLSFQLTASLLQPLVGHFTDRRPMPFSLVAGMVCSLVGLLLLSACTSFVQVILSAALVGLGSSVFHPESSRVARLASGGQHGMAQSVFQVGGNAGTALGPLLAALVIVRLSRLAWFALLPLLAIVLLSRVCVWYGNRISAAKARPSARSSGAQRPHSRARIAGAFAVLIALIFSKYFYLASMTNYYTFYLIDKFHLSVRGAQLHLFVFLGAVAAGTIIGGPIGDRIGRKYVIWVSILGVAPFTLALPHLGLTGCTFFSAIIGVILASAFSAILVYAQELIPGRIGLVSGLFFGFAFGMAGIGSALLGEWAKRTSVEHVFQACAFLPLIGLLAALLPDDLRDQPAELERPAGLNLRV